MAGGWRYVTRPEFDSLLRKFHEVSERSRLSLAALETLAIIAYRQPITLPEIQDVRGVNSAGVVNTLPALPNLPSGSGVVGMMDGQLSVAGTSCSNPTHHFSLGPR